VKHTAALLKNRAHSLTFCFGDRVEGPRDSRIIGMTPTAELPALPNRIPVEDRRERPKGMVAGVTLLK
jgi:hypothetical protein